MAWHKVAQGMVEQEYSLELAAASSQGQVCSSLQTDKTGRRGHQDRNNSLLLVLLRRKWPPGRRARCRHLGKVPLETLEWDCSPTAVMQAAASLLSNTEKQHKPSWEKLPMAAQSRGAEHADRTAGLGTGVQQSVGT